MTPVELQRHLIAFGVIHGGLGDFGTRADGVRDDDGKTGPRTREAIKAFQRAFGMPETGEHDGFLEATLAGELATLHSRHADGSIGFRALAAAFQEWCGGVCEVPMGSNTGPKIREYFAVCERKGAPVGITAGEWCAASASWCVVVSLREGEKAPHGPRIAGVELETDAKAEKWWRTAADARAGLYLAKPGDLVINDRSTPTAKWQRHVCRLVALRGETLWTIGGNESNEWRLTPRKLGDAKNLGFGAYPVADWTAADERRIAELCPGTAARRVSEAVCS